MDLVPLFLAPLFAAVLLAALYSISWIKLRSNRNNNSQPPQKNQKITANSHRLRLVYSVLSLTIMIILPWIIFYVTSGTRLAQLENFVTTLFILSLLIIPAIAQYKNREH